MVSLEMIFFPQFRFTLVPQSIFLPSKNPITSCTDPHVGLLSIIEKMPIKLARLKSRTHVPKIEVRFTHHSVEQYDDGRSEMVFVCMPCAYNYNITCV